MFIFIIFILSLFGTIFHHKWKLKNKKKKIKKKEKKWNFFLLYIFLIITLHLLLLIFILCGYNVFQFFTHKHIHYTNSQQRKSRFLCFIWGLFASSNLSYLYQDDMELNLPYMALYISIYIYCDGITFIHFNIDFSGTLCAYFFLLLNKMVVMTWMCTHTRWVRWMLYLATYYIWLKIKAKTN